MIFDVIDFGVLSAATHIGSYSFFHAEQRMDYV